MSAAEEYDVSPGQTQRSAPALDNAGLFLRERLWALS